MVDESVGYVFTPRGQVKPFHIWRRIKRGRNIGCIEITLFNGRKIKVFPGAVRRFPVRPRNETFNHTTKKQTIQGEKP